MKKTTSLLLVGALLSSIVTTEIFASASKGQRFYMKKMKAKCKKDGIRDGSLFAIKHNRQEWKNLYEKNAITAEWVSICPHAEKKVKKMKPKDVKNLYDFVWKYASDGELPSCG